jgi:hypothetical protein
LVIAALPLPLLIDRSIASNVAREMYDSFVDDPSAKTRDEAAHAAKATDCHSNSRREIIDKLLTKSGEGILPSRERL